MSSVQGTTSALMKALETQSLIGEIVTEAGRVMDPNAMANEAQAAGDAQAQIASAVEGVGRVFDILI
jgi:hypothetical protein